jgi:AcrR family transcriptional regulator
VSGGSAPTNRAGFAVPTRRVGRPRSRPEATPGLDPREEILKVAAELFTAKGYAATTTRMIAEGVGLRQASLFHHFARKEEILAELLDRTVRPAISFADWAANEAVTVDVVLHALCWWDSHNLCSRPDNLAGLQLLHEAREDRFRGFWEARDHLRDQYRRAIDAIARSGRRRGDVELTTTLVFGLVESVLMWFERDGQQSPEQVASAIANAAVGIAGVAPGSVAAIEVESAAVRQRFASAAHTRSGDEPHAVDR